MHGDGDGDGDVGGYDQAHRICAELLNVLNFTPAGFEEDKIYPKKCMNFVKIEIATKWRIYSNIL